MCVHYSFQHLLLTCCFQREIKVSRDGTEVEPTIGQMLIDEWEKTGPPPVVNQMGETAQAPTTPLPRSAAGRGRSVRNTPRAGSWASRAS